MTKTRSALLSWPVCGMLAVTGWLAGAKADEGIFGEFYAALASGEAAAVAPLLAEEVKMEVGDMNSLGKQDVLQMLEDNPGRIEIRFRVEQAGGQETVALACCDFADSHRLMRETYRFAGRKVVWAR